MESANRELSALIWAIWLMMLSFLTFIWASIAAVRALAAESICAWVELLVSPVQAASEPAMAKRGSKERLIMRCECGGDGNVQETDKDSARLGPQ